MGWSYGVLSDGREVGYAVQTVCETQGCENQIDRGLGYLCGQMHGQDDGEGCGHYFCGEHLVVGCGPNSMCDSCYDQWCQENPEICCECGYPIDSLDAERYHSFEEEA
jgi:hypothetical protein